MQTGKVRKDDRYQQLSHLGIFHWDLFLLLHLHQLFSAKTKLQIQESDMI